MIQPINDGGPAFPLQSIGPEFQPGYSGMTLRQYASIKLCVPDSGLPWLDEMIVQSNRERLAAAALPQVDQRSHGNPDDIALECYQLADAMLKAREAK
jgi:hypothetical protein